MEGSGGGELLIYLKKKRWSKGNETKSSLKYSPKERSIVKNKGTHTKKKTEKKKL